MKKHLLHQRPVLGLASGLLFLGLYACTEQENLSNHQIYTDTIEVSIYENPEADSLVASLTSLDSDPDNSPTYSLLSATVSGLRIDGSDLVIDDPTNFDYEANPVITGEIQATLGEGMYTSDFTINLLNSVETDEAFTMTWETTTADESIALYTHVTDDNPVYYDYDIDWGDGTTSQNLSDDVTHTYTAAGTYTVKVTGKAFPGFKQEDATNAAKLKTVEAWGSNEWQFMANMFINCVDLAINATDAPILNYPTKFNAMFQNCTNFNSDIGHWDTHNVTDMSSMFRSAVTFNQDIGDWDVSNVVFLNSMFYGASTFNQDLNNWDTSSVTGLSNTFRGALAFNGAIGNWDVSNVITLERTFNNTLAFNQDISGWDTSNVLRANYTFNYAVSFNQDISTWDMSNVTWMDYMFSNATAFNQPIGSWNVSSVTEMSFMFVNTVAFNQDLSRWNTRSVSNMSSIFENADGFNQDISSWDMSNVEKTVKMFKNADAFNQDLSAWDMSNVTNVIEMFKNANAFEQDLSTWDVSNVTSCTNFRQNVTNAAFISPTFPDGC